LSVLFRKGVRLERMFSRFERSRTSDCSDPASIRMMFFNGRWKICFFELSYASSSGDSAPIGMVFFNDKWRAYVR